MFNNPFSMVVAIVAIISVASIVRARYGLHRDVRGHRGDDRFLDQDKSEEYRRLHAEIAALKDRVVMLEQRVADHRSGQLREHEAMPQGD